MKKILLSLIFALAFCGSVSAERITITLSNGQVVYVDSEDFDTMADLMAYIDALEKKINQPTIPSTPTPTVPVNPNVPGK